MQGAQREARSSDDSSSAPRVNPDFARLSSLGGRPGGIAAVVGCEVSHILIGERRRDRLHGRVAAFSALVFLERLDDVRGMLPTDLGDAVDLRVGGAPTVDAVAARAHLV